MAVVVFDIVLGLPGLDTLRGFHSRLLRAVIWRQIRENESFRCLRGTADNSRCQLPRRGTTNRGTGDGKVNTSWLGSGVKCVWRAWWSKCLLGRVIWFSMRTAICSPPWGRHVLTGNASPSWCSVAASTHCYSAFILNIFIIRAIQMETWFYVVGPRAVGVLSGIQGAGTPG